jgi:hypothetical protein
VLAGRLSLADAVIESVEDRLSLLPIRGSHSQGNTAGLSNGDPVADFDLLCRNYDLVLVDLGRFVVSGEMAGRLLGSAGRWIHAAIAICDVRDSSPSELNGLCNRLREAGIDEAGVVENFV